MAAKAVKWYNKPGSEVFHACHELTGDGLGGYFVLTECGRTVREQDTGRWVEQPLPSPDRERITSFEVIPGYRTAYGHRLTANICLQCCRALRRKQKKELERAT